MSVFTHLPFFLLALSHSIITTQADTYKCGNWIRGECINSASNMDQTISDAGTQNECEEACESLGDEGDKICCYWNGNTCRVEHNFQDTINAASGGARYSSICYKCPANCETCTCTGGSLGTWGYR